MDKTFTKIFVRSSERKAIDYKRITASLSTSVTASTEDLSDNNAPEKTMDYGYTQESLPSDSKPKRKFI